MPSDRYVILGLGRSRSKWFSDVAVWSSAGAVPADFVKCLSVAEVKQKLNALQPTSILMLEAGTPGVDADLIHSVRSHEIATVVVCPKDLQQKWLDIGATAVLPQSFSPPELLNVLSAHGSLITRTSNEEIAQAVADITSHTGKLIAVCGPGGTGTSTIASVIAQTLSDDVMNTELVCLVDMARNADLAMLHNIDDVVPGLEEVIESNRNRRASAEDLHSFTFHIQPRGYRLVLGSQRPGAWTSMSKRSIEFTLEGLRAAFNYVIADITGDFEGELDGGSIDVEERNALARLTARTADIIVVVGSSGLKGTHSMIRTVNELLRMNIAPERIFPTVNRTHKKLMGEKETTAALKALTHRNGVSASVNDPGFVIEKPIEHIWRNEERFPKQLCSQVYKVIETAVEQSEISGGVTILPEPIAPGSLGIIDEAV